MPTPDGFFDFVRRTRRRLSRQTGGILAGIFRGPRTSSPRDDIFPGLFVRELEPRRVLSASSIALQEVGKTLILSAGSQAVNGPSETSQAIHQSNTIQPSGTGLIHDQSQAQHLTLDDLAPDDTLTVTGVAASGDFTITSSQGGSLLLAAPPGGLTIQAGADSTVKLAGAIDLDGGNLTVSAGSIEVDGSLVSHGGSIDLDAGPKGTLLVSGKIDVSDTASGHAGGNVELLGDRVGLIGQTQVDASGDAGGGSVLIGGDYHGANAGVLDATITYVGPDVHISADAISQGNGGHVVVWSNESTTFLGDISAQGGKLGGNGGSIETSSKDYLDVGDGSVSAAASHGQAGTWLLDPENVTIASTTAGGTFDGGDPNIFTPTSSNATVSASTIDASLDAGTSVTITTGTTGTQNGDITVSTAIAADGATAATPTLALQAAGNIFVNNTISGSAGEALNVDLEAGGNITVASPITTFGGTLTTSGIALDNTGTISTAGGNVIIDQTGAVTFGNSVNTGTGSLSVTGSSIAGSGALTVGGGLTTDTSATSGNQSLTAAGTIGVTSFNAGTGTITLSGGTFSLSGAGAINADSGLNLSGATLDLNGNSLAVAALSGTSGTITDNNATPGTSTLTVNQSTTTSFSGTLADGPTRFLALVMSGNGTLALDSADSYSGGTTINAGTVQLGNAAALGSGGLTMSGGELDLNGNSIAVAALSGTTGTITDNNATPGTSTLTVNQSTTTSFSGTLADGSTRFLALVMSGNGTLALDGADSYSGGTTINAGTVQLGNAAALGSGGLTMSGGELDLNGNSIAVAALSGTTGTITDNNATPGTSTLTVNQSTTTSFSGTLADGPTRFLALVMSGNGTLALDGADSYSGGTTINAGTVQLGNAAALGSGGLTMSGGELDLNGNSIAVAALSGTGGTITDNNATPGTSTLTVNQSTTTSFSGTLADGPTRFLALVMSGNGTLALDSADSYSGGTTINAGTVQLGNAAALGSGELTLSGGELDLNGNSIAVAALSSTGGTITDNNATPGTSTLTVNQSTTTSFSGTLADGPTRFLALVMSGNGLLALDGANSYSGGTQINAGTVQLGNAAALGTGAGGTTVAAGATLDLNGQNVGNEAVTLNGSGIGGAGALVNSSSTPASLGGPVTLASNSTIGGSGDLDLTGGIGGPFTLTLVGGANLNATGPVLDSTVAAIVDNKSGGSVFIDQGAGGVDLSGTMTGGSSLHLSDAGTTTLVGPLSAGSSSTTRGSVTLGGAVVGGTNILSAGILGLNGDGSVGTASSPLLIQVGILALAKSGGDSFISQNAATPLALTGVTAGNLTLEAGATTIFSGRLTAAGGLLEVESLLVRAPVDLGTGRLVDLGTAQFDFGGTALTPTVETGGTQIYAGAATLEQNTYLTSDSSVVFGQTVDRDALGQWNLTIDAGQGVMTANTIFASQVVNAGGDINFFGIVGGGPNGPIGVLTLSGHGSGTSSIELDHDVTTSSGQTYNAQVVLTGSVTLSDTGASPIAFMQTIDSDGTVDSNGNSPWSLTVLTDGVTEFYGPVGGTAPLSGLDVQGYSATNLGATDINGGSIVTSGTAAAGQVVGQTFGNAVILSADTVVTDNSGHNVIFGSTVDSQAPAAWALTVNTAGYEVFSGTVGGSAALASLTTDASGTIGGQVVFNAEGTALAPTVTTTGSQTYYNAVLLELDTALAAGGSITTFGTVDSAGAPRSLTLAASGNITFNDNIGANDALANLTVTQANQVVFGGADVKGPGPRSSGPLDVILTAGNIDIGQTSAVSGIVFDAGPGAANSLLINATTGNIRLNGPVTLDSSLGVDTAGGNVLFTQAATIDSRAGENNALAIFAGSGSVTFEGDLGARQPLGSLTIVEAGGGVFFGPTALNQPLTVNTAGQNITIGAAVTLDASLVIGQPTRQAGTIDFTSTMVSQGTEYNSLTIYGGTVDFHGNVGRLAPDPVGNPNPNFALGTVSIFVSGSINIDPGVEIRVWHEDFGIPGGVSRIETDLQLGPVPPQHATSPAAATPANPTQTITGYFGLAPNYTENGENFTIVVRWDDALRDGNPAGVTVYSFNPAFRAASNLNAGGTLNLVVGADGSIDWSASSVSPGTGSGVVQFTITRTYSLGYLASVTNGLHADVTVITDSALNFTINGERITSSPTVNAPVTPVAEGHEGIQFTAQAPPVVEFQAYTPTTNPVVNSTQQPSANTLASEQPVRELVKKVVRRFILVKVDLDGKEGTPYPLPDNTLEDMPALLQRFAKTLPNGHYRIYLVEGIEGGPQTTRLLRDFYKSGKSLGDPVHQIPPGSIEGQGPEAPAGGTSPTPGGNSHGDGKTSENTRIPKMPGGIKSRAVQGAMVALGGLGTAAIRRDWKQRVELAMASGAGRCYRPAARALRQLRRKTMDLPGERS